MSTVEDDRLRSKLKQTLIAREMMHLMGGESGNLPVEVVCRVLVLHMQGVQASLEIAIDRIKALEDAAQSSGGPT